MKTYRTDNKPRDGRWGNFSERVIMWENQETWKNGNRGWNEILTPDSKRVGIFFESLQWCSFTLKCQKSRKKQNTHLQQSLAAGSQPRQDTKVSVRRAADHRDMRDECEYFPYLRSEVSQIVTGKRSPNTTKLHKYCLHNLPPTQPPHDWEQKARLSGQPRPVKY